MSILATLPVSANGRLHRTFLAQPRRQTSTMPKQLQLIFPPSQQVVSPGTLMGAEVPNISVVLWVYVWRQGRGPVLQLLLPRANSLPLINS
ncbi:hypothetical protein BaRGS_00016174 [Batillaria attramentaria]|uniref:Uncharacterized protein n=1 Tax=Batillaria attramentaria TaxID=370345 RepID=A0ABD0KZC3_9CAEN